MHLRETAAHPRKGEVDPAERAAVHARVSCIHRNAAGTRRGRRAHRAYRGASGPGSCGGPGVGGWLDGFTRSSLPLPHVM